MSDSLSKLDATQNYLEKNGMSFDERSFAPVTANALDARVREGAFVAEGEGAGAHRVVSDDDEYSISSLKAKVADNGGKLPDCVRMLLLSGAFGPLLLAVAKGLLAEGLRDPKPSRRCAEGEGRLLEE